MQGLVVAGLALTATALGLVAYGRRYLATAVGFASSGCFLTAAVLAHSALQAAIAGGNALVFLALLFWGGPKGRRRTAAGLGDESRQLRAGLLRRLRERRAGRRGPQPQPSR